MLSDTGTTSASCEHAYLLLQCLDSVQHSRQRLRGTIACS